MPLYSVTVSRIVCDTLTNTVEIEAPDAASAEALALEQYAEGEIELYFQGPAWEVDQYPAEADAREVKEA